MYWEGDREFFGFGMGSASSLNGLRFQRPRNLKRYSQFVSGGAQEFEGCDLWSEGVSEFKNLHEALKTIFIGRLRTLGGVDMLVVRR